MRRHALFALVLATACAKHQTDKAAAEAPTKRERCQAIATQATQTAGMAMTLLASGLSDDASGLSASDKAELDREMAVAKTDLVNECMSWDDEVLDCFRPFAAITDKCQRTLAIAMGGSVAPDDVPEGPAPKWTHTLTAKPASMAVTATGRVIAALEDETIVAIQDGKQRWSHGELSAFRVELPPTGSTEPTIVLANSEVIAINDDGTLAFRTKLPLVPDPDADPEYDALYPPTPPNPKAIVRRGDHWLIGDDEARFIKLTPGPCDKGECLTVEGQLDDEYFDRDSVMQPTADGSLLLWEGGALRLLDSKYGVRFDARARDTLDGFAVASDGSIIALVDHDLVQLDPVRCHSARPFAPSTYPQKGRLYFEDSDECPDCSAPPSGCVRSRHYVQDSVADRPTLLGNGAVVVDTMDGTRALLGGKQQWSLELGAAGVPMPFGGDVVVMGEDHEADGQVSLWRLAADGKVRSRSLLAETKNLDLYWSDDGHAVTRGPWVAVSVKRRLFAFEL